MLKGRTPISLSLLKRPMLSHTSGPWSVQLQKSQRMVSSCARFPAAEESVRLLGNCAPACSRGAISDLAMPPCFAHATWGPPQQLVPLGQGGRTPPERFALPAAAGGQPHASEDFEVKMKWGCASPGLSKLKLASMIRRPDLQFGDPAINSFARQMLRKNSDDFVNDLVL